MKTGKNNRVKRYFLILVVIAIIFVNLNPVYKTEKTIYFVKNIAEAAETEQVKIVLKAEPIHYQGETLWKAVVCMNTKQAGIEAYSIYLDYDQKRLKPFAIYKDKEMYDEDYYQYEGLGTNPIVNYAEGHVNAQYASFSNPVNKVGSILFIAYFKAVSKEDGLAEISIKDESSFTGSDSNNKNKTIAISKDSITSLTVDLGDIKQGNNNIGSSGASTEENKNGSADKSNHANNNGNSNNSNSNSTNTTINTNANNNSDNISDSSDFMGELPSGSNESEKIDDKKEAEDEKDTKVNTNINANKNTNESKEEKIKKKKVKLNKTKATIKVGKTLKLKVKNTTKKVIWYSNKKKVASVNKKGKVVAKKRGTAIIKAKVKGIKVLKCKITVK